MPTNYTMKINPLPILILFLLAASCTKGQKAGDVMGEDPAKAAVAPANDSPLKNHLGINAFEWDFSENNNPYLISPSRKEIFRSFGFFRHYMDWEKLEAQEGKYTFNPTNSGGWNYDMIYEWCKAEGIEVLSCLKTCPPWLQNTYPANERDAENVPAPYGLDRSDPASYLKQAKVAFQFAARYGHNTSVDRSLVTVSAVARWNGDFVNTVRIGLGYINYIECDNERDKTWKGDKAYQSPDEYAANMSAFYDGHMGKLGKNAGVKSADPSMKVVMGGLSDPDPDYVVKMIEWCKKNRGYKADGSVNLCFDVINYHLYNNDYTPARDEYTVGRAPELSNAAKTADEFVSMSKKHANGMEVWITESGYDLNPKSPQRAIAIGNKSVLITQADWMLRSSFLYIRHGLKKSIFYLLNDVDAESATQYSSSGFMDNNKRRPVADYFYQVKKLMGDFQFQENISTDPMVDVYGLGDRKIYILFIPDQVGRSKTYQLDLGAATSARVYTLVPGANEMSVQTIATTNGKLPLTITETPIFVEKN
jgi:hypothetical protein